MALTYRTSKLACIISPLDFAKEIKDDHTSNFVNRIPHYKETVTKLEESLSMDKELLVKLKNLVKDKNKNGNSFVNSQMEFSKALNRLGESEMISEEGLNDICDAFLKFAGLSKELGVLKKTLMDRMDKTILFPLENLLKTEFRGSKSDLRKRSFDKAWRDFQDKFAELERQKKRYAKEPGVHRMESAALEIADNLEKERKYLQLAISEYLLKVNEVRTKTNLDLLQHLFEYYQAQQRYFREGLQTIEQLGDYMECLMMRLANIKNEQEKERVELTEIQNRLRNTQELNKGSEPGLYTLHQAKGDASFGSCKVGYLNKRSEGRLRNIWQRRLCKVRDGFLEIYHADESKQPTRVNLLTCQMKPVLEDKLCFYVVSFNRTYHFQAENDICREEWMSVLLNSKNAALNQEFQTNGQTNCFMELQNSVVSAIRALPGNEKCCDCNSTNDPTWISTNFGIIVCIECSGIHREMGVHISKIQSLTLDNIGTSQLLVARFMSNEQFNKVMEATVQVKLNPNSSMSERKTYIKAKYEEKQFAQSFCSNAQEIFSELERSIANHNLHELLQVFAEASKQSVDLNDPLPGNELKETILHYAILPEYGLSLHIVDFLVQNSRTLDKSTCDGNTPLHYCVIHNQCESMRLLLRSGADPGLENKNGKTPIIIAQEKGFELCEDLLMHALQSKKIMFVNVNIDWQLSQEDGSTDFSDDDNIDDPLLGSTVGLQIPQTPEKVSGISSNKYESFSKSDRTLDRSLNNCYSSLKLKPPPNSSQCSKIYSSLSKSGVKSSKKVSSEISSLSILSRSFYGANLPNNHETKSLTSPRQDEVNSSLNSLQRINSRSPLAESRKGSNRLAADHSKGNNVELSHQPVLLKVGSNSRPNSPVALYQSFACEKLSSKIRGVPESKTVQVQTGKSTESLDSFSDDPGGYKEILTDQPPKLQNNNVVRPKKIKNFIKERLCQALYDCEADNEDELSFEEGDTIVILNEETEDENWMEGYLLTNPKKRGLFPVSFVNIVSD